MSSVLPPRPTAQSAAAPVAVLPGSSPVAHAQASSTSLAGHTYKFAIDANIAAVRAEVKQALAAAKNCDRGAYRRHIAKLRTLARRLRDKTRRLGAGICSTSPLKAAPFIAPSRTMGTLKPSTREPTAKVGVFQRPLAAVAAAAGLSAPEPAGTG